MKEDIIEILKEREKDMEALIQGAKRKGAKLREEAAQRTREIRNTKAREVEEEIASMRGPETERIKKDVAGIEKGAEKTLTELRKKSGELRGEAVDFVTGILFGDLSKNKEKSKK